MINVFLCPSANRSTGNGRDDIDPGDPWATDPGYGYGIQDYGPTCYTDIDPFGQSGMPGSTLATPFRNKLSRANGLLKQGSTKISEVTDGLSQTFAIGEDAGRDASYASPYNELYYIPGVTLANVPQGYRRYWRWASPTAPSAFPGRSTTNSVPITTRAPTTATQTPRPPRGTTPARTTSFSRITPAAPISSSATAPSDSSRNPRLRSSSASSSPARQ